MTRKRVSKSIMVGDVKVGGDAAVSVQSMTKTDTRDVVETVRQIKLLEDAGCEIVFDETVSSRKVEKDRPQLQAALTALSPGDELVLTKLD